MEPTRIEDGMDDEKFQREMERNKEAYERLGEQIRRAYAGQYVGMAFGRVVASGPDFDTVSARVNALVPPSEYSLVFPADIEPVFEPFDSLSVEFLDE